VLVAQLFQTVHYATITGRWIVEERSSSRRRCRNRRPASKEHKQVGNQEGGAKVRAESFHFGRQSVWVAPPTRIQNPVAGRFACRCGTAKHQPQVPCVGTGIGWESQVASEVRLRQVRILEPMQILSVRW